ncbi:hypothetical protein EJ07DRAFT_157717 [Lizonia empirigonia]|nr:hypothetical protein EJ07DRAFT_157717 [Lizonia empirigonia]
MSFQSQPAKPTRNHRTSINRPNKEHGLVTQISQQKMKPLHLGKEEMEIRPLPVTASSDTPRPHNAVRVAPVDCKIYQLGHEGFPHGSSVSKQARRGYFAQTREQSAQQQPSQKTFPQRFTAQRRERPKMWTAGVLNQPLFSHIDHIPQDDKHATKAAMVRLMEQNRVLKEAVNKESWERCCTESQLEAAQAELNLNREQLEWHTLEAEYSTAATQITEAVSLPIVSAISAIQSSSLDTIRKIKSEMPTLLPNDYKFHYDRVRHTSTRNPALSTRPSSMLPKKDELFQRMLKHVKELEEKLQAIDSVNSGDLYIKHMQDAMKPVHEAVKQQLGRPFQDYADEQALIWGYNRGFYEGFSMSRAKNWSQKARDAAFYRGWTLAEQSMAEEMKQGSPEWTAYTKEFYARGYHAATSFSARMQERSRGYTEEHLEHHLQQARLITAIAGREDDLVPFLDKDSLRYLASLGATDELGYFKLIRETRQAAEALRQKIDDPAVALSQIPLKHLPKKDQKTIRHGRKGGFEASVLGDAFNGDSR